MKLLHTKDGDNILKFFILLQNLLNFAGSIVMFLADNIRLKDTGSRFQRINRRINTLLNNLSGKYCGGIQMGEGLWPERGPSGHRLARKRPEHW